MSDLAALDRLEQLVQRLEALGLTGSELGTFAAVNPDGTPGNVAANELIESAWGNSVVNTQRRITPKASVLDVDQTIGQLQIEANMTAVGLDVNGQAVIMFRVPFLTRPVAIVNPSRFPATSTVAGAVQIVDVTTSALAIRVFNLNNTPITGAYSVDWIAIGLRP